MTGKRRPSSTQGSPKLNFRPQTNELRTEQRGTRPTSKPTSIKEILTLMVLHVCRKSLFFDTNLKVGIYLGALFLISLIADVIPIPKGYLARSDNVFNQYFVKIAWFWNILLLTPFLILTSYVYCCGQKDRIVKHHLVRLVIATFFWYFWTSLFNYIESKYGICTLKGEQSKANCLKAGHFWNGFDLSGHCFILIYGSLCLIEEARCVINWDKIKEYIRNEEHFRKSDPNEHHNSPLRFLTEEEFSTLKESYEKYTPYIRALFVAITLLQILWDIMLVCTMLYYHIMIEKLLGGAPAILTWFATYKLWYDSHNLLPKLPGEGLFKYNKVKTGLQPAGRRRIGSVTNGIPQFMGMPLYSFRTDAGPTGSAESQLEESF
ncbi:FIT family protein CG10671 [Agrilus planipennis]|uniref:FIT family protein CG10671 n=1 Tax=Agrilus planipennis TaxID=224129 RepID=A0A1W4X7G6_AGRPL|nr:FIT family protein CG10671 [Agrilus planipennis]